jgi:hypothetical protein
MSDNPIHHGNSEQTKPFPNDSRVMPRGKLNHYLLSFDPNIQINSLSRFQKTSLLIKYCKESQRNGTHLAIRNELCPYLREDNSSPKIPYNEFNNLVIQDRY